MQQIVQREVTWHEAKWIHRAMGGNEKAQKTVGKSIVGDLVYKQDFAQFMEANRDRLELVGEVGVCK